MYNAHPYFPSKIWAKKCTLYREKYGRVYICNSVGSFLENRCILTCSTGRLVAKSRNLSKRQLSTLYTGFLCHKNGVYVGVGEQGVEGHFRPPFGDIILVQ